MENFVVEALESPSSVHESKRHPEVLKKTEVGDDGSPQYVLRLSWNLVIGLDEDHT